jgi:hypothetical protein
MDFHFSHYSLGREVREYISQGFYVLIDPDIRKCVVFLGYEADKYVGTGFLLGYKKIGYLVTVKHIAIHLRDDPFLVRINLKNRSCADLHGDKIHWFYHPDDDVDLAVTPLSIPHDSKYDTLYIRGEEMIGQADGQNIGIGDICYTIGLFHLLAGKKRNLPIVHTGNIALLPGDERIPVTDWYDSTGKKRRNVEAYLIESQSLNGLSGSPVFARPTVSSPFHMNQPYANLGTLIPSRNLYLIGVWQAAWEAPPDQIIAIDRGMKPDTRVPVGMGFVVPATKLIELLESGEAKEHRDASIAKAEAGTPAGSLD